MRITRFLCYFSLKISSINLNKVVFYRIVSCFKRNPTKISLFEVIFIDLSEENDILGKYPH